ncbi:MAG TPA: hypothetical protein VFO55_09675 [Gemmatimonadaceae bacterium]|nr:hypothetical protein [Gemmatimonadaceae bacterium]
MKRIAILTLALAASAAGAQQNMTPRPLGAVQVTSKDLFGLPTLARPLPGGGVIVNDAARRRLLLLDPSLESAGVIADSTSGAVNGYGQRPGALVPYVADSTLFLDPIAGSFLVIDPAGKVARVMSPPRPNDNVAIASLVNGFPGFDAKGRMVYRSNYRPVPMQTRDGGMQMPTRPDSAPLLRVDLDTRQADTVGVLRTPKFITSTSTGASGGTMISMSQVPLSMIDDWAVLSDGTIAIVRGRDYRVDLIMADGSKRTSEKIPFDWKRLTDEDKLALADSIQKAPAVAPGGTQMITSFGGGEGMRVTVGGGGGGQAMAREVMVGTAVAAASPAGAPGAPGAPVAPMLPAPAIADMPDYMPVFTQTSARPDADTRLWIRTTRPGAQPGNVVYDVIDNKGSLVDRVDVPKGMQIVGFAKGGVVFLSQREGYGYRILRASVR